MKPLDVSPAFPRIFHRVEFLSAPNPPEYFSAPPKYFGPTEYSGAAALAWRGILRSRDSQEAYVPRASWTWMSWNEDAFLRIAAASPWKVRYARQLLRLKAWAAISDFLRLYALHEHGGLYADWDVEFIQSPENLIHSFFSDDAHDDAHENTAGGPRALLGFEPYTHSGRGTAQVGAHVAWSSAGHPLWRELYQQYAKCLWTPSMDILPGVLTRLLESRFALPRPRRSSIYYYLPRAVTVAPSDVLYPVAHINAADSDALQNAAHAPQTLCLHWERSQHAHARATGWRSYLHELKKTPRARA